jgi:hypothetical protein
MKRDFTIPSIFKSFVIGKAGITIKKLKELIEEKTGFSIQRIKIQNGVPKNGKYGVTITTENGNEDTLIFAEKVIKDFINNEIKKKVIKIRKRDFGTIYGKRRRTKNDIMNFTNCKFRRTFSKEDIGNSTLTIQLLSMKKEDLEKGEKMIKMVIKLKPEQFFVFGVHYLPESMISFKKFTGKKSNHRGFNKEETECLIDNIQDVSNCKEDERYKDSNYFTTHDLPLLRKRICNSIVKEMGSKKFKVWFCLGNQLFSEKLFGEIKKETFDNFKQLNEKDGSINKSRWNNAVSNEVITAVNGYLNQHKELEQEIKEEEVIFHCIDKIKFLHVSISFTKTKNKLWKLGNIKHDKRTIMFINYIQFFMFHNSDIRLSIKEFDHDIETSKLDSLDTNKEFTIAEIKKVLKDFNYFTKTIRFKKRTRVIKCKFKELDVNLKIVEIKNLIGSKKYPDCTTEIEINSEKFDSVLEDVKNGKKDQNDINLYFKEYFNSCFTLLTFINGSEK